MTRVAIHIVLILSIILTFSFAVIWHEPFDHLSDDVSQVEVSGVSVQSTVSVKKLSALPSESQCLEPGSQNCQGWILLSSSEKLPSETHEKVSWPGISITAVGHNASSEPRPPRS